MPIIHYLQLDELSQDELEAKKLHKWQKKVHSNVRKALKNGKGFSHVKMFEEHNTTLVLVEVHQGVYGSIIDGWTLARKLLKAGYYWPTLMKDSITFVRKCNKF